MNSQQAEHPRGVVLAGGDSTRFGTPDDDKALWRFGSKCCLELIVDTLASVTAGPPVIAVRSEDQRAAYAGALDSKTVQFVFDSPAHDGPLAGLRGVAGEIDATWLFCCACDMPLLSRTAVEWLITQLRAQQSDADSAVGALAVEYADGIIEPLHTLYRREHVLEASERLHRTAGPQDLFAELRRVHTVSPDATPEDVPLRRSVASFNTRTELRDIESDLVGNRSTGTSPE